MATADASFLGDGAAWRQENRKLRALVIGAGDRHNVLADANRLQPVIEQFAEIVLTDFEFQEDLTGIEADVAIVFGGDGSLLRAARQMKTNQIPVIGVNLGKLGFLADQTPDELQETLQQVADGQCCIVPHLMFQCSVHRNGALLQSMLGLNEMAVLGGPPFSILDVDLYVDSELATTYSCDGLIISTPVGSTAHSLSAGGPILRKSLQAFVILPIAPHTLTVRPVVDSAERVYEVVVAQPNEATSVVVDGRVLCPLGPQDRVRVERAEPSFKMLEVRGHTYYRTLREKLGWAGRFDQKKHD